MNNIIFVPGEFLSTLSLRRATGFGLARMAPHAYFYPRSPCGERPPRGGFCYLDNIISIHALLAESDIVSQVRRQAEAHFYPRSPCGERHNRFGRPIDVQLISIHALLAESDPMTPSMGAILILFLSTLSLRRAT